MGPRLLTLSLAALALARLAACGEAGEPGAQPAPGGAGAEESPAPAEPASPPALEDAGVDAPPEPALVMPPPPVPDGEPRHYAVVTAVGTGSCALDPEARAELLASLHRQVRACCRAHLDRRDGEPGHASLTLLLGAGLDNELSLVEPVLGERFAECVGTLRARWPEDALPAEGCRGPEPVALTYACADDPPPPDAGASDASGDGG